MAAEKSLKIVVTSCNVKKIDLKAYGVAKAVCQVILKVGDKEVKTSLGVGLDPTWEETFDFPISDETTTKCFARFLMGEEGVQKQIGDEQEYLLPLLKIGVPVYKGLIVPGGQVDMMFTAAGFGEEDKPVDTAAFMDMMGDEGGMMMDSDEEEEGK